MENINLMFYEEFKKLEKLCNELYINSTDIQSHGVKAYIDDMKNTPYDQSCEVDGWETDFRKLKEYNHKRNQISHQEVSFYDDFFTFDDVVWIRTFRYKILNQTDPLSLLNGYKIHSDYEINNKKRSLKIEDEYYDDYSNEDNNNSKFLIIAAILSVVVMIISIITLLFQLLG